MYSHSQAQQWVRHLHNFEVGDESTWSTCCSAHHLWSSHAHHNFHTKALGRLQNWIMTFAMLECPVFREPPSKCFPCINEHRLTLHLLTTEIRITDSCAKSYIPHSPQYPEARKMALGSTSNKEGIKIPWWGEWLLKRRASREIPWSISFHWEKTRCFLLYCSYANLLSGSRLVQISEHCCSE